jgi:LysM repeat protein
MGNFEKLSVLVIVVIIVMILVVAIYEWTGSPSDSAPPMEQAKNQLTEAAPPALPGPAFIDPVTTPKSPTADPKGLSKAGLVGGGKVASPAPAAGDPKSWWIEGTKDDGLIPPDAKGTPETPASAAAAEGAEPKPVKPTEADGVKEIAETTHVVASGDTLGGIAIKYYGSTKHYPRIEEANPGLVAHSLRVGQKLKIPALKIESKKASGPSASKSDDTRASGGNRAIAGKEYKVQAGDTWPRISKDAYKTSERWPEIFMKNMKLTPSPDDLRPGLVIMIPN